MPGEEGSIPFGSWQKSNKINMQLRFALDYMVVLFGCYHRLAAGFPALLFLIPGTESNMQTTQTIDELIARLNFAKERAPEGGETLVTVIDSVEAFAITDVQLNCYNGDFQVDLSIETP